MPRSRRTAARDLLAQAAHVGGRAVCVVDDEVGVLLADRRAAHAHALQAQPVDQRAGRWTVGGVAEHAAGGRHAQRLVCLPPAADLVEPAGDDLGVGGLSSNVAQVTTSARLGRGVLQDAVAVGSARGRRGRASPPCRRRAGRPPRPARARTSDSCAPALAHTAPPTVPGMARPNSRPDRPAPLPSVAARAIGRPESAREARALERAAARRGCG